MELGGLISGLRVRLEAGSPQLHIHAVVDDSRSARAGCLFVARAGRSANGRQYIADAVERGAVAVLSDRSDDVSDGVAALVSDDPGVMGVEIARRLHSDPTAHLKLIGVTGTNGKTTTAFMIRHLLGAAGKLCGLIGTIEIDDGRECRPACLTTPGAIEMLDWLARMVRNGCEAVVMEVSSHALHQGRTAGIAFDVAVFTNLSGDHLDYHGTMDEYAAAKARLFETMTGDGWAVVNANDAAASRMLRDCPAKAMAYGLNGADAACRAKIISADAQATRCEFAGPWGALAVNLPLIGHHNVANMAAALCAAHALGLDAAGLKKAIEQCPAVPGRLEAVKPAPMPIGVDLPFTVLVDYAHTDDALENVLKAVRPITRGRLRVLFGCGGDRDPTKRPRMAAVACRLADRIVITSDNPRTEDPDAIIRQILDGVPSGDCDRVTVEADRAAAIERIIADAEDGDIVLLAGKGHEDYQIIGTQKRPFDDRQHAVAAMKTRAEIQTAEFGHDDSIQIESGSTEPTRQR